MVKVKFLKEWMGNKVGSTKVLHRQIASELEARGTIKIAVDKEVLKNIDSAPMDKMIKTSQTKTGKRGRPKK